MLTKAEPYFSVQYTSIHYSCNNKKQAHKFQPIKSLRGVKIDGVGPVDNRPSTNKLHHFVRKKTKKKLNKNK